MPACLSSSFEQVAAACFPLPGCSVSGYAFAQGTRYNIIIYTPPGAGCPDQYRGTGRSCYEALAAAVQLFLASAHAYPGTVAYAPQ
ncbi:hypothetical protein AUC43_18365 [Hymenobacter sedentarius]|uniref:Uncharacterized protein n=1 Tax=Hymenobacter sedentarius TaxID=1411621 RepID=A0A0U3T1T8_9BACT|nr:hypothetical protein [Hymenobacter sedentarius]ALW86867.1 hypothetical protein AUC43_18365 [Hymenobacter sedentarius]